MPRPSRKFHAGFLNNRIRAAVSLIAVSLAFACVTVNVNFPESAVQKATDDYVRELYRAKEKSGKPASTPQSAPSSSLEWLVASAQAAEQDVPIVQFQLKSPKINEIHDRQAGRVSRLNQLKTKGALGESKEGLLEVRESASFKNDPVVSKQVETLLKEENQDRKALYDETERLNAGKVPADKIKRFFGKSFRDYSPSGTWVQDEAGAWRKN